MTKAERLAAKIAREKAQLTKQRQVLAQAKAQLRDEARKATDKRRYQVGALADEAGLLAWTTEELAAVFAVLARVENGAQAVVIVGALLDESGGTGGTEDGVADAWHRVSAAH